jgi:hypothetical protein
MQFFSSSLFGPNILLSTLLSNTLSLCSSPNVTDHASHPYRTAGKTVVPYILIHTFLDSRREDERFWTEWPQTFPEFNLTGTYRETANTRETKDIKDTGSVSSL